MLSEEESTCVYQFLSKHTITPLPQCLQVLSYPKVAINKAIIGSFSSSNTTRTNHIVAYMDKNCSIVKYGAVQRLLTVKHTPETFHIALLYPLRVCACNALQQLQQEVPEELVNYCSIISSDFMSCSSQSPTLVMIFTEDIIMQVFNVNSSLCSLVNENERET